MRIIAFLTTIAISLVAVSFIAGSLDYINQASRIAEGRALVGQDCTYQGQVYSLVSQNPQVTTMMAANGAIITVSTGLADCSAK